MAGPHGSIVRCSVRACPFANPEASAFLPSQLRMPLSLFSFSFAQVRPRAPACSLVLALALAGCSGLGIHTQDTGAAGLPELPGQWSQPMSLAAQLPQDDAALVRWWQQFSDATLSDLIAQAFAANPSLRSASQAVLQARAQADVQRAGQLPSLDATGSAQRSRSGNQDPGNSFGAGLDARWELDLFGRLRAGVRASEADLAAATANWQGAYVSLAAEVALNYVDLRNQQQRLAIAQRNLASQEQTLQISQWRLQAGLATSLVTEQARAAVAQTAAQIPGLQASLAQSRHALAVLTGQAPAALDNLLQASAPLPQLPESLVMRFPADTLRQRPDVQAAQQRVQAALARVDQAEAARYPRLSLSGSLGLRAASLGALSGGSAVAASILGGLSAPVFDGGAARAQVRAQSAALEQARANYVSTVLGALQEVEDSLAALQGDRERLLRLQTAAQAASNADLLAQQRYASGLVDFQTVLETQRSLLSAQDSVASTSASLVANHVRLYKALGGGWSSEAMPAATSLPADTAVVSSPLTR